MAATKPKRGRPSRTAELVAAARAEHLLRISEPVFEDNLAYEMCGPFWRTVLASKILTRLVIDGLLKNVKPIVPVILTRARFGEDRLESAVGDGLDQYVILGAGFDTFAMRRKDLMANLQVYELDQPATQELKLRRMQKRGMGKPSSVRYIQSDLNKESLHDALDRAGFDAARPAMFSWFGVTYYLGIDTVRATLENIATNMAPGSSILFDYLADPAWIPSNAKPLHERCAAFVAKRGEPWISSFNPPDVAGILSDLGFEEVDNLEPDKVSERYSLRNSEFDYPPIMGICYARTAAGSP
ncbi:MAG: SAM-dependent methyltransferase [Albidovulum sp.]|nr:SAM-dependent methyltransferase [Albidovulum sp.]MDE0303468.1 SAM-dependent methyltransferase [Albidovulum sp.]